jgi:alkylation response protein AidB-like acyl-CoA dehydrogenase
MSEPRPEIDAIRRLVDEFGRNEIRPHIQELEERGEFPRDLYRRMGELGFFGCVFGEDVGGSDVGFEALAVVAEGIAHAYPPLSAGLNLQAATVPLTIQRWGTHGLVSRYVPGLIAGELLGYNAMSEPDGGTDFLGAMRTRATPTDGGYLINGSKMWITNANVADVGIVYAKTDPDTGHRGVTAFVVPTATEGFATSRLPSRSTTCSCPTTMSSARSAKGSSSP